MTWAQRLKRVLAIDIETCPDCGGVLRVIACIEEPWLIRKILGHVRTRWIWADGLGDGPRVAFIRRPGFGKSRVGINP
jgi:hypothetical protein